jgi:L,D-peptidoglycan transpeptidase YkuD (ErfK/YbiS/YcfS/YnhG family)
MLTFALALALHVCGQQVRVVAPATTSTTATVSLYDCGRRIAGPWRAHVGIHGLSEHHREGDGTTPLGTFGVGPVVYGLAPNPGTKFRYHRLACGDWWDEDPASPTYNRFRHLACRAEPPFGGGSEALWRATVAYRLIIVVDYNAHPVVAGRGSAIFMHVDRGRPTKGCISLAEPHLRRLLRLLHPGATIRITA